MSYIFHDCSCLTSIDLSSFNTSNVNDMSYMFMYCSKLESIDLSSVDTSKVKDISCIFSKCSSLKKENIKISKSGKNILKNNFK